MSAPVPKDIQEAVVRAYLAGATLERAAAPYGLSLQTCCNILKRLGIPRRSQSMAIKIHYDSPEVRKRISTISKGVWENPEYRKNHRDSMRRVMSSPEYRERRSIISKSVWANLGLRKKQSERQRNRWTPEKRKEWGERSRQIQSAPEFRKRMSEIVRRRYIDPKMRVKIGECSKRTWANPGYRLKQSKHNSGANNPMFGRAAPHGKLCPTIKGDIVRSTYERDMCNWLFSHGIRYQYEPRTFDFGDFTYTPDLYVPSWKCFVEIKGWWGRHDGRRASDKVKYMAFLKRYGNIILLEPAEIGSFRRESTTSRNH